MEVLARWWLQVALAERSDEHLRHACQRVARWFAVAVVRCAKQKEQKPERDSDGGDPEAHDPHALVLVERQEGVGEEGADVERQVEVAEEGEFGASLHGVRVIKLVRSQRRYRWLIPADPKCSREC